MRFIFLILLILLFLSIRSHAATAQSAWQYRLGGGMVHRGWPSGLMYNWGHGMLIEGGLLRSLTPGRTLVIQTTYARSPYIGPDSLSSVEHWFSRRKAKCFYPLT
jgi:hypothetical protein